MTADRPENPAIPRKECLIQLAQAMSAYQTGMVESLVALCRIPSVKGTATVAAPFGEQTAFALDAFLSLGQRLGFRATNLDNRAGYLEYGESGPIIAILGHLDVVPAGSAWTTDPFAPVVLADRVIARGAIDDKGPVVAALYAMKALIDEGFRPDARLRLIVGLDEETGSACMEHYVRVAELPAAGFSPDADFPVIYAEKGIAWVDLDFEYRLNPADPVRLVAAFAGDRPNMVPGLCQVAIESRTGRENLSFAGRAAHASTPWAGQNAIAQAMLAVRDFLQAAKCRHPFVDFFQEYIGDAWDGKGLGLATHDESGPLTLNAGVLELGEQSARLTLDIRYPVTLTSDWLLNQVKDQVRDQVRGHRPDASVSANLRLVMKPLLVSRQSGLVKMLTAVYQGLTGSIADPIAIGGGTYARSMPNIVAFGPLFPGQAGTAHQAGEYILLQPWLASAAIYKEALRTLASSPAALAQARD